MAARGGQVLGSRGLTLLTLLSTHRRNGLFPCHDKLLSAPSSCTCTMDCLPLGLWLSLPLVEKAHDSHPAGEGPEPDPQSSPRHSGLDPTFIQSASPLPPSPSPLTVLSPCTQSLSLCPPDPCSMVPDPVCPGLAAHLPVLLPAQL